MTRDLASLRLRFEHDVVIARQRAREAARLLGFGNQGQTRIATVVSELARRAYRSGEEATVDYLVEPNGTDVAAGSLLVRVRHPTVDEGDRDVRALEEVLAGARRLVEDAVAERTDGVTTVTVRHDLPEGVGAPDEEDLRAIAESLRDQSPNNPFEELQRQNEELVEAMAALRKQERERSRLLEAERAAREEAQQAVRSREEILSIVSHDLRNPLGAIQTGAQFLLEQPDRLGDEGVGRQQLQAIVRSAQRANRLIQDLLDLSSIDQGTLSVDRAPEEVEALVADLRELMGARVQDAGVTLHLCGDDDLPLVCVDRDRVVQALANLVANAVRFTPEDGEITVDASAEAGMVVFSVTDTGPGVPEGDRARLFDRFWTNGGGGGGAGLGLAIVRAIAEGHGGRAWHDAGAGPGACFRVSVPTAGRECGEGRTDADADAADDPAAGGVSARVTG